MKAFFLFALLLCTGCGAWEWGQEARDYQNRLTRPPIEDNGITNVVGE